MLKIKNKNGIEETSLNVIRENLISFYQMFGADYQSVAKDKMEEFFMSTEYELHIGMPLNIIETVFKKTIFELNVFWKKELDSIVKKDNFIGLIKDLISTINNIYYDGYKLFFEFAIDNSNDDSKLSLMKQINNPDLCLENILKKKLEEEIVRQRKKEGKFDNLNVYDYADNLVKTGKYENHLVLLEHLMNEKKDFINHIITEAIAMSKEEKHYAVCEGINDIVGAYKAAEDYYKSQGSIMKLFNRKAKKFMRNVKNLILKSMTAIGYTLLSDDTFDEFVEYHSKSRTGHDFLEYKDITNIVNGYIKEIYSEAI